MVRDAVLSSVRVLRDYQINGAYPAEVKSAPKVTSKTIEWSRPRLDGAAGYALTIAVENGEVRGGNGKPLSLTSSRAGEPLRLRITALTGETPLTPLSGHLLSASANDDRRSREVLTFLSYEEKFLAGSWRFNTYFGRDTLMSLRLLLPVLEPQAVEGGLEAVVQRLAANGEVAHEEDIGEFAVLRHRKQGGAASDAPIYDYNMIDDDFMLAPVAAAYAVRSSARSRARQGVSRSAHGERRDRRRRAGAQLQLGGSIGAALCAEAGTRQPDLVEARPEVRRVARQSGRPGGRALSVRRQRRSSCRRRWLRSRSSC